MDKRRQDKMYMRVWKKFAKTGRGFAIQQRLDRERADRLACRDSLLNDDEYQERDFGSRLMSTLGFTNGGALNNDDSESSALHLGCPGLRAQLRGLISFALFDTTDIDSRRWR